MRYPHARVNQAYRLTNPTFGTGIVQNTDVAFAATKPLLLVFNSDAAGGLSIYLDYIKLINAVAGVGSTSAHAAMILDTVDRFSAGGSRLTTTPGAVQPNTLNSVAAKARIDFGAVTAIAASAARQISRDMVKTQAAPCWTVGDEVYVKFDTLDFSPALSSGAGTAIFGVPSGPVIIAPGHSFLLYLWHPALATAPQWEIEMAWWEAQDKG